MHHGAAAVAALRGNILRHKLAGVRGHSRFKIAVVWLMLIGLFSGAFYIPYRAFVFLQSMGHVGVVIIDRLMYLLFLGLFVMLVFSNAIICFAAHFRARETAFFFSLPLSRAVVFFIKYVDSIIMSSWAVLCLLLPVMAAYAWAQKLDWVFYVSLLLFFAPFAAAAGALGCGLTMCLVRYVPARVYRFFGYFLAAGFIAGFMFLLMKGRAMTQREDDFLFLLTGIVPHFAFSQFVFLPNYWITEGIFKVISGDYRESLFWWLLLASNALFWSMVLLRLSEALYYPAWTKSFFSGDTRQYRAGRSIADGIAKLCFFARPALRVLVSKDIKIFWRDPAQWTQFTVFFGLLGIYFANIRNLGYEQVLPFWKNMISFLNLAATNLTLASLSVRFVFPQFSLEGRRFWILGLAPLRKTSILMEKFWVNSFAALCVSLPLIFLSNTMLNVSREVKILSLSTVGLMCFALTALCVGLGALFPDFREDNPAEIVSGFGGTLALVLCLVYIGACVALLAFPFHLLVTERIPAYFFGKLLLGTGAAVVTLSAAVIGASLYFGCRALRNMDF